MRVLELREVDCDGPADGEEMVLTHDAYLTTTMGEYDVVVVRDDDLSQNGHLYVSAFLGGEFVGGLSLYLRNYWVGIERGGWFSAFEPHSYVLEQHRGKGIAIALYRWIASSANMVCNIKHTQAANDIWSKLYDEFNGAAFYCDDDGVWVEDAELDKCETLSSPYHTVVIGPINRYGVKDVYHQLSKESQSTSGAG